jgi:hypothetical protein
LREMPLGQGCEHSRDEAILTRIQRGSSPRPLRGQTWSARATSDGASVSRRVIPDRARPDNWTALDCGSCGGSVQTAIDAVKAQLPGVSDDAELALRKRGRSSGSEQIHRRKRAHGSWRRTVTLHTDAAELQTLYHGADALCDCPAWRFRCMPDLPPGRHSADAGVHQEPWTDDAGPVPASPRLAPNRGASQPVVPETIEKSLEECAICATGKTSPLPHSLPAAAPAAPVARTRRLPHKRPTLRHIGWAGRIGRPARDGTLRSTIS